MAQPPGWHLAVDFDKICVKHSNGAMEDILTLLAGAGGTATCVALPLSIHPGVLSLDLSGFCTSASTTCQGPDEHCNHCGDKRIGNLYRPDYLKPIAGAAISSTHACIRHANVHKAPMRNRSQAQNSGSHVRLLNSSRTTRRWRTPRPYPMQHA